MDDMIRHANVYVCATCKPAFIQKLAEGADIRLGEMRYAGFWLRFGAVFLDGIILLVPNGLIQVLLVGITPTGPPPTPAASLRLVVLGLAAFALQIGIAMSYEVFFIGKYGSTLGKMAAKIKVVTADGGRVSYLRALGRYFAKLLSGVILFIGYIMAAFDPERRSLHDRLCNTRVIFK